MLTQRKAAHEGFFNFSGSEAQVVKPVITRACCAGEGLRRGHQGNLTEEKQEEAASEPRVRDKDTGCGQCLGLISCAVC